MFEKHGDTRFDFLREATEGDPPDSALHKPGDGPSLTLNTTRPLSQNRLGWTGFVRSQRHWYISAQTWKDEFCRGFDMGALNSELEKLGALEMETETSGRKRPPKVVINGQRGRYYTVTPRIFSVVSDPSEDPSDD
jgi:hypothetical protein